MGHAKRAQNLVLNKGDAISVTLTFRRNDNFISQLIQSLRYIKKYLRAYSGLRLVPELGEGRLHFHYCGMIKNVLKHKIFMHNWKAKWGNVHIDTWDQKETFIRYLEKERLLKSLLQGIAFSNTILTNDNYNCMLTLLTNQYYTKTYEPDTVRSNGYVVQYRPISEFFKSNI